MSKHMSEKRLEAFQSNLIYNNKKAAPKGNRDGRLNDAND